MAEGSAREISLGECFGDVAVKVNGVRFEVHADGSLDAYTNGPVRVHPANDDVKPTASTTPQIGDKMPDGAVYAGISPDTGKAMYATPADAPLTYTFNQAQKYAENLDVHGHKDWRAPTKGELNVLFQNRAAIGGFDISGSYPAGWYWSSSSFNYYCFGWAQRFSDGYQLSDFRDDHSSLRCVR